MKYSKICVIALVGLILAVFASSTAFASSVAYSGTDTSELTGTGLSCQILGTISQQLDITSSVQLDWNNVLENQMSSGNAYWGVDYSSGYAGGADWTDGSNTIPPGYEGKVTIYPSPVQVSQMPPPPDNTDTLNINHDYEANS